MLLDFRMTLFDMLCPQPCVLCETWVAFDEEHYPFCQTCRAYVHFSPVFSRVESRLHYSLGLYEDVLQRCIQRFKFEGMRAVGDFLAEQVLTQWKNKGIFDDVDVICPVPISKQRYFYRGFNQSALLAKYMGDKQGIVVEENLLVKVKDIVPQMELKREERLSNVKGAFRLKSKDDLSTKRILIVDDVLTTGATVLECIRTIREEWPTCKFKILTLAQA